MKDVSLMRRKTFIFGLMPYNGGLNILDKINYSIVGQKMDLFIVALKIVSPTKYFYKRK